MYIHTSLCTQVNIYLIIYAYHKCTFEPIYICKIYVCTWLHDICIILYRYYRCIHPQTENQGTKTDTTTPVAVSPMKMSGISRKTSGILPCPSCPFNWTPVLQGSTGLGIDVPMFHITQLLGISFPTDIVQGDVQQIPIFGTSIPTPVVYGVFLSHRAPPKSPSISTIGIFPNN